jgi:hypothetical protein
MWRVTVGGLNSPSVLKSTRFSKDKPAVGYQAAKQTNDVFGQRRSLSSSKAAAQRACATAKTKLGAVLIVNYKLVTQL